MGNSTYVVVQNEEIKIRFLEKLKKVTIKRENRSSEN